MPPHCDTLDGPVVKAARLALETRDVNLILPYVPKEGEAEVIRAFDKVLPLRNNGARELADLYFFETVVRIHRVGEGAAYTGLKPAGLDEGPIIPIAEKALETGSPDQLIAALTDHIRAEVMRRFNRLPELKKHASDSLEAGRDYVEAMLGLQVWSHKVYQYASSAPHDGAHNHGD